MDIQASLVRAARGVPACCLIFVAVIAVAQAGAVDKARSNGAWHERAPMPTPRFNLAAAAVNGKIYTVGGMKIHFGGSPLPLSVVEEYDPAADAWTTKAPMPTARFSMAISTVNGKLYAFGGYRGPAPYSAVEEYNPATNVWSLKADMTTPRTHLASAVLDGNIYLIGGSSTVGNSTAVEVYDPATDTWESRADMPTARSSIAAGTVKEKIYVVGGSSTVGEESVTLSLVEEYDPATDTWARKADMPTPRKGLAVTVADGKLYAFGGRGAAQVSAVEEYDPATDTWTRRPEMIVAREGLAAVTVDGVLYSMGGRSCIPECAVAQMEALVINEDSALRHTHRQSSREPAR